jgi:hypothetical protein
MTSDGEIHESPETKATNKTKSTTLPNSQPPHNLKELNNPSNCGILFPKDYSILKYSQTYLTPTSYYYIVPALLSSAAFTAKPMRENKLGKFTL